MTPAQNSAPTQPPLTRELAQRVVEQVAPSLVYNVNIMNDQGVIIGSVDRGRVGTLHDGARQAARDNRTVSITAGQESAGTRPGVNIPLRLDGRVVGVVGVTGDPGVVLPVAQVLVLAIQMLVVQEQLRDSDSGRESHLRDLFTRLSQGMLTEDLLLVGLAAAGRDLAAPWQLSAFVPETPGDTVPLLRALHTDRRVAAADLHGAVWVLQGTAHRDIDDAATPGPHHTLLGRRGAGIAELSVDAQKIALLLAHPRLFTARTGPPAETDLADLTAQIAVAALPGDLADDLGRSLLSAVNPVLRQTARVFIAQDLSIARTAAALTLHRNTVVQRLDRIEALTTVDLRHFSGALRLHLALLAEAAHYVHDAQESLTHTP